MVLPTPGLWGRTLGTGLEEEEGTFEMTGSAVFPYEQNHNH